MARFYKDNETYRFDSGEGLDQQLHEDNLFGNFHIDDANKGYDRVGVQDPRDESWWFWTRFDMAEDDFAQIEYICRSVGSFLVRHTAIEAVRETFDANHQFNEAEYAQFMGAE